MGGGAGTLGNTYGGGEGRGRGGGGTPFTKHFACIALVQCTAAFLGGGGGGGGGGGSGCFHQLILGQTLNSNHRSQDNSHRLWGGWEGAGLGATLWSEGCARDPHALCALGAGQSKTFHGNGGAGKHLASSESGRGRGVCTRHHRPHVYTTGSIGGVSGLYVQEGGGVLCLEWFGIVESVV